MKKAIFSLIKNYIIDIIYPRCCPSCGDVVFPKGLLICNTCKDRFDIIKGPRCMKCSKPIGDEEIEYCYDCAKSNYHFEHGLSVWVYNKQMRKSIVEFKYKGRCEYVDYYVSMIIHLYGERIKDISPDVLVPIPIHYRKKRERGYNQADLIAKRLGRELNIPVRSNLLIRDKDTVPQKGLSNTERIRNLEKAFSCSKKELMNMTQPVYKIMLIDDIYTTGSTIEACSRILKKNGIEKVYFLSLCIGKGF